MRSTTVYLGLGANLGERQQTLEGALARLGTVPGIRVVRVSSWHRTAAADAPPSEPAPAEFLNGVAELQVSLPAAALLALCKQLEAEAGRDFEAPRNAARPLDLDILLFGEQHLDGRELVVPHPRMFERGFVMAPLAELVDVSTLQVPPRPRVIHESAEFAVRCTEWLHGGCSIGLVPTMGALHEGHLTLVRAARDECDRVAVTIFVNPLQFGPGEDLDSYPRTMATDLEQLAELDVDVVFVPPRGMMYPDGFCTSVTTGAEAKTMEGATRPAHFEGVTTVVAKLFALARPSRAYFGQKDAQQVAVLRRMVCDLDFTLEFRVCPVVREPDGLAMSSRNAYLSPEDRQAAPVLHQALCAVRDCHAAGERDVDRLLAPARTLIEAEPRLRLDYLNLRTEFDLASLPPGPVEQGRVLVAAFLGSPERKITRLIDNMSLTGGQIGDYLGSLAD